MSSDASAARARAQLQLALPQRIWSVRMRAREQGVLVLLRQLKLDGMLETHFLL